MRDTKEIKLRIIEAGYKAVNHLVKVAEEDIINTESDTDVSADKMKNAAAAKKLAIFDAFEILNRIEADEKMGKKWLDINGNTRSAHTRSS